MNMNKFAVICMCFSILFLYPATVSGEDGSNFDRGQWNPPEITSFDLNIINESGNFVLDIVIEGSSPNGTEDLEITIGTQNGTDIETADFWISEASMKFLGMGYELAADGNSSEKWSKWHFDVHFEFPLDVDLDLIQRTLETISDIDLGDIGFLENMTDQDPDIQGMIESLYETKIFVIARSYNSTGSWGQSYLDVTDDVQLEIVTFAADEGLIVINDPDDDDPEPGKADEASDKGNGVLVAALGGAALVFLMVIVISVVLIYVKKGRPR